MQWLELEQIPNVQDVLAEYKMAKFAPGTEVRFSDSLYVRVEQRKHGFRVFVFDRNSSTPVGLVKFYHPKKGVLESSKRGLTTLEGLFGGTLFTPHTTLAEAYQNQGIASAIYRWFLDDGNSFVSWDAQTKGGNILWRSLARFYPVFMLNMTPWGDKVAIMDRPRNKWNTRMLMLGKGVSLPQELEER